MSKVTTFTCTLPKVCGTCEHCTHLGTRCKIENQDIEIDDTCQYWTKGILADKSDEVQLKMVQRLRV